MEVIVLLEDTTTPRLTHELFRRSGKSLGRAREGTVNPDAPACRPISINKTPERLGFEPRNPFYQVNHLAGGCIRPLCHLSKRVP